MDADEARTLIARSLLRVVPDADLDSVEETEDLREALELDSLDFLSFAEMLSEGSGQRIDEADYPRLVTMHSSVDFLSHRVTS